MQLASMLHGSNEPADRHSSVTPTRHFDYLPERRTLKRPLSQDGGRKPSSITSSPYYPQSSWNYSNQNAPRSPPSPPVEEGPRPSLPSISSLLTIADGEKTSPEPGFSRLLAHQPQRPSSSSSYSSKSRHNDYPPPLKIEAPKSRMTLPPTPPMQSDSVVDGNHSPSAASTRSSVSVHQPYYHGSALNNVEPHQQRQPSLANSVTRREMPSSQPASPYGTSSYSATPYTSSPALTSAVGSLYSPQDSNFPSTPTLQPAPTSAVYEQRPLPTEYSPSIPSLNSPHASHPSPTSGSYPSPTATGNPLQQHHHYISASSQAAFPQTQDRYICSTCNKAFSRPSSLRIHSHSHTGEKPYKCPQPGCGKAFSVRSNMKRHERGCHAAFMTTSNLPT